MKKMGIKGLLLAAGILIAGNMLSVNVCAQEISAEEMEADKKYTEYPITVNVIQRSTPAGVGSGFYDFEKPISEGDQEYIKRYGRKLSGVTNDHSERTVEIYADDLEVLEQFAGIFEECYDTCEMPELSGIYAPDNQARKENMVLLQAWMYQSAIVQNRISGCESAIKVKDVENIEENLREVVFQLEQDIDRTRYGMWYVADLVDTEDGPRIIYLYVEDVVYQMMRDRVKPVFQSCSVEEAAEILKNEIYDGVMQSGAKLYGEGMQSGAEEPDRSIDTLMKAVIQYAAACSWRFLVGNAG